MMIGIGVAAVFAFLGWMKAYRLEAQINELRGMLEGLAPDIELMAIPHREAAFEEKVRALQGKRSA